MTILASPQVGVLHYKNTKGISCIAESNQVTSMAIMPLDQALMTEWPTDAHFCCYHVPHNPKWPRIRKIALSDIRAHGGDVQMDFFAIDIDTPDHAPLTIEWLSETMGSIISLPEPASNWRYFYTTRGGLRLIYQFNYPLPVDTAESYICGIHFEMAKHGVFADESAKDWTRLFRLPQVLRDGVKTSEHPLYQIFDNGKILDLGQVTPMSPNDPALQAADFVPKTYGALPDYDLALQHCERVRGNRTVYTEWFKDARRRLKTKSCYDAIFNNCVLAEPGERDPALAKMVGTVIRALYKREGTTPEHIYGLTAHVAFEFDNDEDWPGKLWSLITRFWESQRQKQAVESVVSKDQELTTADIVESMSAGMREWCSHPDLSPRTPVERKKAFIQRHAVAALGNYLYCMRQDGKYEKMALVSNNLIPRMEILGLDPVTPLWIDTDNGPKRKVASQILTDYVTPIMEVRIIPQISGGYIDGLDGEHPILYLPGYRRSEILEAEYNEDVDTWLSLLAGAHKDDVDKWIAWSLAFEEGPICALSLQGKPGAGKKLLIQGLAECLQTPRFATANDLTGQFQSNLLSTPFVHVNEGWPKVRNEDISTKFRQLVSGDTIMVRELYKPPMVVQNPVRIVITANNSDVVKDITDGKDLSPYDREAIADRLFHFQISDEASNWLSAQGGLAFTGQEGGRWIRGDGGSESDFIIAKHFLFLYQNRHRFEKGSRFLMHGNVAEDSKLMQSMLGRNGSTPIVTETILSMLEMSQGGATKLRGLAVYEGRVFVLVQGLVEHYRTHLSDKVKQDLKPFQIRRVLLNYQVRPPQQFTMLGHEEEGDSEWHELGLSSVLDFARKEGFRHSSLLKIMNGN